MADLRISQLNALAGADLNSADLLVAVDTSASETKKLTVGDLIANGVTLISDDTIPGAKILFAAGDIATAALADSAVTTAKLGDDSVTAAKLANESTVDLVTTLPTSGAFTGQFALDTDDNFLYVWDGSAWVSLKAAGSINTVNGDTAGLVNITATTSGSTVTVAATIDDTTSANQFLAGPTGAGGVVGYRTIDSTDLPTASTSAKGTVIVNAEGLRMDSDTIEIDNDVTATTTHHVVTYSTKGLITGGRAITSADLPIATDSNRGAVIAGNGLAVDVSGNLSIDNAPVTGTFTKVTVTAQGLVSLGETLDPADIPDHSAAKLTSGTIASSIIADNAITASKLADESTVLFGGASATDDVTTFPTGGFKGQLFFDESGEDLYINTGTAFVPITVLSGNLVNAGAYNANTNLLSSVTTAGSSAGFSVGAALPAPAGVNLNHYVVVDTSGTGSGAAPAVALAPPDMLLSQGVGTQYQLIDVSNAIAGQTASNISLIATGGITATDVQAGIQELDSEKLPKAGGTMTGNIELNNVNIVFEGSAADAYETTLTVTNPTADRTITLPNVTGTVVTTGDTGSVTSTMLTDGTIVNADINASAEIAVSKLANGTARQLLQTDSSGSGVEFTSNVDVPGTLDVTGAATLDSTLGVAGLISANGKVSFPLGTAAAPSLLPGSDTNTGIFSPGADSLAITTAGTQRVTVDSSGNVGIGSSAPTSDGWSVANDLVISSTGNSGMTIKSGTSGFGQLVFNDAAGGLRGFVAYGHTDDYLGFGSAGAERMRIDSSGNVGIGTTAAIELLEVHGDSPIIKLRDTSAYAANTGPAISLQGKDSNESIVQFSAIKGISQGSNNGQLSFETRSGGANIERLRIDSSGNVGIGTSSPSPNVGNGATLHLSGSSTTSELRLTRSNGTDASITAGSSSGGLGIQSSARIGFSTSGSNERMRIESDGKIAAVGTSGTARVIPHTDNVGYLGQSGNRWQAVYAVTGTIQTSDSRQKTEITGSNLGYEFIKSLRPVSYKWIDGGNNASYNEEGELVYTKVPGKRNHYGFIAQEVKEALGSTDFGGWVVEDVNDAESAQSLRYSEFIAPLTKALQEAITKIETLEQRLSDAGIA